jgi:3-hydroxyisobutyrate dehydrogenase-like beta-hydroxyacid dehydrogenase
VLCASTCDPERIAALGQRAATRGLRLLETPVSGASGQVSRGEGVGLIGGDAHVIAEVEPVLRAMFPTYFHIGKIGDGGRAKLAVNLILGLNRLAVAEVWSLPSGWGSIPKPSSRWRAAPPPIRRSWMSRVPR